MRILLLTPPLLYTSWPHETGGGRHFFCFPPASYPALAATIPEHDVVFVDGPQRSINLKRYREHLEWADVIGISMMGAESAMNVELNLRVIKRLFPGKTIVGGGHHATFFAEEWIERGLDIVVSHEGEAIFPKLIKTLHEGGDLATVPGIVFQKDGRVCRTEPPPFAKKLDDYPMPRFDIIDAAAYQPYPYRRYRVGSIETSRGCPYRCEFCSVPEMWKGSFRMKSIERVIAELDVLHTLGIRFAAFVDDAFAVDYNWTMKLLDAIIEHDYGIYFWSFMRADTAANHPDLLEKAAHAGLVEVAVGLESMNPDLHLRLDKGYPKGYDPAMYRTAYENLRNSGIMTVGLFVSEYPGDTYNGAKQPSTRDVCDIAAFDRFTPTAGARAVENLRGEGYHVPELFCVDISVPSWTKRGAPRPTLSNSVRNTLSMFRPGLLSKGLYPDHRVRPWGPLVLRATLTGLLQTTSIMVPRNMKTQLLLSREKTLEGKWRILRERVLGDEAVEAWTKRIMCA